MIDLSNLHRNMFHVVRMASDHELQIMLGVIADELATRDEIAARHAGLAVDALYDKRERERRRRESARHLPPLPPHEGAGGERPKS